MHLAFFGFVLDFLLAVHESFLSPIEWPSLLHYEGGFHLALLMIYLVFFRVVLLLLLQTTTIHPQQQQQPLLPLPLHDRVVADGYCAFAHMYRIHRCNAIVD